MNVPFFKLLDRPWLQWLLLLLFISFGMLFAENMGLNNEVDVLPLARQFAQPDWIPDDWYLNQSAGYRFLFSGIVGWMTARWGFLATSIGGRLVCYGLVSWGLVMVGRRLQLSLPFLLLAIALFLYNGSGGWSSQGMAAKEWIVGALEAKSVAYGLVLLAIADLLGGYYRRMALLLGLATSFHVLVGGWMLVSVLGWWGCRHLGLLFRPEGQSPHSRVNPLVLGGFYMGGAALAIPAVLKQLSDSSVEGAIAPSFIYVFLRLSHHLNPYSWPWWHWLKLVMFIGLFGLLIRLFLRQRDNLPTTPRLAWENWILLVLCSLVPYGLGILLAPLDTQGKWLQYYPFRLGDVLLPLGTCLLLAYLLEQWLRQRNPRQWLQVRSLLLVVFAIGQTTLLAFQIPAIASFPGQDQDVTPAWADLCTWVRQNTSPNSQFVIMPMDHSSFTWLSERPIVVNYKFLPQTSREIVEWYYRMDDVTAGAFTTLMQDPGRIRYDAVAGRRIRKQLRDGFANLTTDQAIALMEKYDASYFLTDSEQRLNLAIAYEVFPYTVYQAPR